MHGDRRLLIVPLAFASLLSLAAPRAATAQHENHSDEAKAAILGATTTDGALSPKLHDLGSYSRKVSTRSAKAQTYFDQGLILAYAFNHAEAERSFREAERLDPGFAMAWWGQAYVLGPNINAPMDAGAVGPAYEAARKAVALEHEAKPWEQGLIDALAVRYGTDPKADRNPLDAAYARAMQDLAKRYPKDPDILAMAAESIMDTFPVGHSLGALLLDLGRPVEAEAVYREDLRRRRENGWALFGLAQSLRAQGEDRATDLAQAEARFQKAWGKSDLALTSSRF